jgi:hypothetical protein
VASDTICPKRPPRPSLKLSSKSTALLRECRP